MPRDGSAKRRRPKYVRVVQPDERAPPSGSRQYTIFDVTGMSAHQLRHVERRIPGSFLSVYEHLQKHKGQAAAEHFLTRCIDTGHVRGLWSPGGPLVFVVPCFAMLPNIHKTFFEICCEIVAKDKNWTVARVKREIKKVRDYFPHTAEIPHPDELPESKPGVVLLLIPMPADRNTEVPTERSTQVVIPSRKTGQSKQ